MMQNTSDLSFSLRSHPFHRNIVAEPVSECSNGFAGFEGENDSGKACCPLGCTKCGGTRCGSVGRDAGLDNTDCCINGVLDNQEMCSVSREAPCVIDGEFSTLAKRLLFFSVDVAATARMVA